MTIALHMKVRNLMGWDEYKTMLWFQTKNPLLGEISPDEMIANGRLHRLEKFIDEKEALVNAQQDNLT